MAIKCCNGCVPPKRTPTCHSTCSDYIIEKAFEEEQRLALLEKIQTKRRLSNQRIDSLVRAVRHKGRKWEDRR